MPEIPDCPGAPPPTSPRTPLPRGACDTHLHVLGPYDRFPLAEERPYTVPAAPLADLRRYMDVMGLDRVVVAHVSAAGADPAVTLDAMASLGDAARGTMMPLPALATADLRRFHDLGMRGLRMSESFGFPVDMASLRRAAAMIDDLPWHIAIWPASSAELAVVAEAIEASPVPVVLDHLAARAWMTPEGPDAQVLDQVERLLQGGRVWLKLSGAYRADPHGAPWSAVVPSIRRLVQSAPERLLWASDWPHVGLRSEVMPQSGELADWLDDIGCDAATRRRILVDNPAALYGFSSGP